MHNGSGPGKTFWIYDIETAIRPEAKEYLASADLGYDSRLKDPAKIEASRVEKRETAIEKAALYWWYGKVVSIAAVSEEGGHSFCKTGPDEVSILKAFFNLLHAERLAGKSVQLIGKSNSMFDDGYLVGRAIALDIGVPEALRPSRPVIDIDQMFSFNSQSANTGKLAYYGYGIGQDKSASGSDVAGMVDAGDWDRLASYNMQDVVITAELFRRWRKEYTPS
jgi:hypothetical protein